MTLDEAWKESYRQYLKETEDSLNSIMTEMLEANAEASRGFELLKEYFMMYPVNEEVTGYAPEADYDDSKSSGGNSGSVEKQSSGNSQASVNKSNDNKSNSGNGGSKPGNNGGSKSATVTDRQLGVSPTVITNYLMGQIPGLTRSGLYDDDDDRKKKRDLVYTPAPGVEVVERISDMKFPKNIIFFIQQLITWIKRVVVYFIEKVKNVIKVIFGRTDSIRELDPSKLKLELERSKKIENIVTFPDSEGGKPKLVKAYRIDPKNVNQYVALQEEVFNESVLDDITALGSKKAEFKPMDKPVVVTIDVSKDLMTLKQLIQHFFDLYDNAFGSNNEELFKTDDLAIVLELFKRTIAGIKTGNISTYEIGSTAVEVSAIDYARVKDNLILTNQNVENLKAAYTQTAEKIKSVSRIITHKEMLMLSGYGISNEWLTSGTFYQIIEIVQKIEPRVKDIAKREKELTKMQKQYEKISDELFKMQKGFMAMSNVTYSTVYQRRVVDLCNAARCMTQVVTLRLTALGLYTKEMKDTKDLMIALARLNKPKRR